MAFMTCSVISTLLVAVTLTTLRCHALLSAYFYGRLGYTFAPCFPNILISRADCAFRCLSSKKCPAFNYVRATDPEKSYCQLCNYDHVRFYGYDVNLNTISHYAHHKTNVAVDNWGNTESRFVHIPSGLRVSDLLTLIGVPDGKNFAVMLSNSDWSLSDPDGHMTADLDLVYTSYFENNAPLNYTVSNFDPVSKTWTRMWYALPDMFPTPYLVVGQTMVISLHLRTEFEYALYSNNEYLGVCDRANRLSPSEVKYLTIPPVIHHVYLYDSTAEV